MTLIYAVMLCLLILVFVQFLLLTVSLETYRSNARGIVIPATLASGFCFAGACWLIRYVLLLRQHPPHHS